MGQCTNGPVQHGQSHVRGQPKVKGSGRVNMARSQGVWAKPVGSGMDWGSIWSPWSILQRSEVPRPQVCP